MHQFVKLDREQIDRVEDRSSPITTEEIEIKKGEIKIRSEEIIMSMSKRNVKLNLNSSMEYIFIFFI